MIKPWLILIACHGAKAGGLDNFSNNLASDLAPLLALFGENMTKQYLSESTEWLDYIIFALAPIGILTAIVSAIRVCGDPSLRAFIGRAQEGEGTVEAELCSSTSRDVCELFNNGGITRVLGTPKILEIVRIPDHAVTEPGTESGSSDKGIRLFRYHLYNLPEVAEWKANPSSSSDSLPKGLASSPNISLNVGIVKRSQTYYFAVATLGFILQAGVMAMAGAGSWHLRWPKDRTFMSERDAATTFILGTLFLFVGMLSCAALVGQRTHERYFYRTGTADERLFWLQPGRQVVGDQTFDAFSYFDDPTEPLRAYTTSTKITGRTSKPRVWGVIIASVGGYIAQFIGLRGMNAYVSIAQLGVMIVMSFLRGTLRMQRRTAEDNRLAEILDQVVGHELDWLAFEIAEDPGKNEIWHLAAHMGESDRDPAVEKLFRYRVQLARLTGHHSLRPMSRESYQEWKDGQVRVRAKARELANAICGAAEALIGRGGGNDHVKLGIKAAMLNQQRKPSRQQLIELTLEPPGELFGTWRMDSANIEGILGLWLWSLKCAKYEEEEDRDENRDEPSESHGISRMRIISAFGVDGQRGGILENMDVWLGKRALGLSECTLSFCGNGVCNSVTRWRKSGEYWEPLPEDSSKNVPTPWRHFFGWNTALVSESLGDLPSGFHSTSPAVLPNTSPQQDSRRKIQVQIAHTRNTLLSHCSQDLYAAMIFSMKSGLRDEIGDIVPTEDAGQIRLNSAKISAAADAFTESGLGPRSDALFCIIPALRTHLRCPRGQAIIPALISVAMKYWEKEKCLSETLLQWAKGCSELGSIKFDERKAFIATAELYRWAFVNTPDYERRRFGYKGIKWLLQSYQDNTRSGQEDSAVKEILDRYRDIARQVAEDANEEEEFKCGTEFLRLGEGAELPETVGAGERARTLYLLCVCSTADSDLKSTLPLAAQKGWDEVVVALLELNVKPDSPDQSDRTALSYGARSGNTAIAETLLQYNASPNIPDAEGRTPLSWAAEGENEAVVKLLVNTAQVELDLKDSEGRTALSWAAEKGQKDVVNLLISDVRVDPNSKDSRGRTPLSWAAEKRHESVVKLLLADIRVDPNSEDSRGRTPLSWAAEEGHEGVVKLLADRTRVELDSKDSEGRTPLSWAAEKRQKGVVNLLLADTRRVDPNSKDIGGGTPLSWAAQNGNDDIVKLLVDCKEVKPNMADSEKRTPLTWAALSGRESVVKLLVNSTGIELDQKDNKGRTPLAWAALIGHKGIVKLLVESARVELNSTDSKGQTPLSLAAQNGNDDVVKLLVNSTGVKLDQKDSKGRTPLAWAALIGHKGVVELLVESAGVELNSTDSREQTPLSLAAQNGNDDVVKLLVNSTGIELDQKDRGGRTPLAWAALIGHKGVVKLLLQRRDIMPDLKDNDGHTPLWHAFVKGHKTIAKMLLRTGKVDVNSKDITEAMRINMGED
jgi:ankyrin repeat protein